jgi:hypothetical protein
MRKLTWPLIVVCFLLAALYSFIYFFVIPNAATFSVPYKWNSMVAGKQMDEYYQYAGKPLTEKISNGTIYSHWEQQKLNYLYQLDITFNADSTAVNYMVHYTFSNTLFSRKGILKEGK